MPHTPTPAEDATANSPTVHPLNLELAEAAFAAWETNFRDKPTDFLTAEEVAAMAVANTAQSSAIYFLALLRATAQVQPCEQCEGWGYWRPPYARERVPCDLCTSAPISAASATTTALDAPLGSKA